MSKEPNLSEYGNAYLRDVDKEKKTTMCFITPERLIAVGVPAAFLGAAYRGKDIGFPKEKVDAYKDAYKNCEAKGLTMETIPMQCKQIIGMDNPDAAARLVKELKKAGLEVQTLTAEDWAKELLVNHEKQQEHLKKEIESVQKKIQKGIEAEKPVESLRQDLANLNKQLDVLDADMKAMADPNFSKPKGSIITIFDPHRTKSYLDTKPRIKIKGKVLKVGDIAKLSGKLASSCSAETALVSCSSEAFRSPLVKALQRRYSLPSTAVSTLYKAQRTPVKWLFRGARHVVTGGAGLTATLTRSGASGVGKLWNITPNFIKKVGGIGFLGFLSYGAAQIFGGDEARTIKDFRSSSNSASASLSDDDSKFVKNFMKRQAEAGVGTHYGMTSERWKRIYDSYEEGVATDKESCFNLVREISSQTNHEQETRSQSDAAKTPPNAAKTLGDNSTKVPDSSQKSNGKNIFGGALGK